jgi:hypothetical protein
MTHEIFDAAVLVTVIVPVPDRRVRDLLGRILSRGRLTGLGLRAMTRLDPVCDAHQCSHPIFCLACLG